MTRVRCWASDRRQGQPLHPGGANHRLVANSRSVHPAVRRHRGDSSRSRRRRRHWQDQLRRVRHGIVERELRVRPGPKPLGSRAQSRRIQRRLGGGRRGTVRPGCAGSDTGGSVRQPASLCGVVGLKPTYGRVSRYGLLAFASSLDQIGPLTLTVRDAARLLEVIAGPDARDATTSPDAVPGYTDALTGDLRGVRLGVPSALLADGVDAEVERAFQQASDTLKAAARRSATSRSRTRPTPFRSTTSSPRPKRARIWRDTTASATPAAHRSTRPMRR